MSAPAAVETHALTKRYPKTEALAGVSLRIEPGEIFALLGPNGAGKTTWISIVCGLSRATSGSASILGHDVVSDAMAARKLVGLVPQEINFDPFFSSREVLRYQMGYYGVPRDDARVDEVLAALGLSEKADANTRELSGGMKRRLLIGKALVHAPKVVFLDEPTAGVDINLRRDLWTYVRALRERGTTIVLTTHYLEEAEALADRVAVIDRGELIKLDRPDALMAAHGRKQLAVTLVQKIDALPPALAALGATLAADGTHLSATIGADGPDRILRALAAAALPIADLRTEQPSLEQVFLALTNRGRTRMNTIGFRTLLQKETRRFLRVPGQTVAQPVVTTSLYFLVFGFALGGRLREVDGIPYIRFIVPGLIMLSLIQNAFLNTASSMFIAKMQGTIVDLLVAPMSPLILLSAFTLAAVLRGMLIGIIVWFVAALFTGFGVVHPLWTLLFSVLVAATFALFGLAVSIWSDKFEQLNLIPTFVITPLTFLGGVFYSANMLPKPWSTITKLNPILYMVDGLRYGLLGSNTTSPFLGLAVILVTTFSFGALCFWMLSTGYKLRS